MNKIKKELNRYIPYLWVVRLNIVKIAVLPNLIDSNSIPVRIPANCFVYIDKLILQFIQRGERPRTANTILKGKSKIGGLTLANLSLIIKLQ